MSDHPEMFGESYIDDSEVMAHLSGEQVDPGALRDVTQRAPPQSLTVAWNFDLTFDFEIEWLKPE